MPDASFERLLRLILNELREDGEPAGFMAVLTSNLKGPR